MKKSTEFVFRLLIAIVEPLLNVLSKLLDSDDEKPTAHNSDNEDNE